MAAPASGLRLGRIFGIPIYLHASWFIIFVLITVSLATQFTAQHAGWTPAQHWTLGIVTSLLFFASVIFHEMAHSVVARHYKIPVISITLFVFGGLSQISKESSSARQEFNIAVAGPASSFFLAGIFFLIGRFAGGMEMLAAAAKWLAWINLSLGAFNLVPGFPLDGGRILRAIAWGITHDYNRAMRVASRGGQWFAYLMIFLGIWQAVTGNWIGGLWLAFIGWFLLNAAQESYAQVAIRNSLQGLRAVDIMTQDIPSVPRDISLEDYIHDVLRTGRRFHFVTADGRPVGFITLHAVREVPREEWANTSVQAAMLPRERVHSVTPEEPLLAILERMKNEDVNQMPVMNDGQLVGMITRDSILRVIQTRLQVGLFAGQ